MLKLAELSRCVPVRLLAVDGGLTEPFEPLRELMPPEDWGRGSGGEMTREGGWTEGPGETARVDDDGNAFAVDGLRPLKTPEEGGGDGVRR